MGFFLTDVATGVSQGSLSPATAVDASSGTPQGSSNPVAVAQIPMVVAEGADGMGCFRKAARGGVSSFGSHIILNFLTVHFNYL